MIDYRVSLHDHARHRLQVHTTFTPQATETRLELPVWIAGSYLVREFARHLSGLRVLDGAPGTLSGATLQPDGKSAWRLTVPPAQVGQAITLAHEVYAFDASVRTAMADSTRVFFNPTSLCLRVQGQQDAPHQISLQDIPQGWEVATGLDDVDGPGNAWRADSYTLLADHPFEIAPFWRGHFEVRGVPHEFAVSGAWPDFDGERLLADTQRICEAEMALWHPEGSAPPFSRYVFMLSAVENGYGGLEHINSTALIARRADLPTHTEAQEEGRATREGYVQLLGLISHEYFHTWSVKRLKPLDLHPIDDQRENLTQMLWFFEGLTSYYDDLLLLRAGLISPAQHRALLAKTLQGVWNSPGRRVQSVAQASHDAWIRYYRPDEHTPNSTVSYYAKGALVGLALDALLRQTPAPGGAVTLDDLMRWLWQRGGQAPGFDGLSRPITEDDIHAGMLALTGHDLRARIQPWLHGTDELPLTELLAPLGLKMPPPPQASIWSLLNATPDVTDAQARALLSPAALGLRLKLDAGRVRIAAVLDGGAAHAATLSVHDEIIAIDGWRVAQTGDVADWLARLHCAGSGPVRTTRWTLCRDQRLIELTLDLDQGAALAQGVTIQPETPEKPGAGAELAYVLA
ncbi:M61 family metallopeptidase [Amphibiibacter pelophylacis]|uniref:Peptidase M61 n=1 Tax=Amphibiibacter pelophylacis TaxID=1799477 RepID=A0ACC6P4G4_9BURK